MLKKLSLTACLVLASAAVFAADEKIDPETYICAELVASSVDGKPPLYEGLQLDGYASAKEKNPVADAEVLAPLLIAVSDSCSPKPTDKALEHWQKARKYQPVAEDGLWRADRTTCGDYAANPDDGSGFIIWLDGYYRGQSGKKTSVFKDQATLDNFLEACKANPKKLIIDVIAENAR